MNDKGILFNIQRFSLHDGDGIRTTIFFKGCNLRCNWCHNPESLLMEPQLMFHENRCTGCEKCKMVCKNHAINIEDNRCTTIRSLCYHCFECTYVCLNDARTIIGKVWTVDEVIELILKDVEYYNNTGGGVTFSGGEPLLQANFLRELLLRCKQYGIHTVIETAGNVDVQLVEELSPLVNLWKVDCKLIDSHRHKQVTGVTNKYILQTIRFLAENANRLEVNVLIVPNVNNDQENLEQTASFLLNLTNPPPICVLHFHKLAENKYTQLGMHYHACQYDTIDDNDMQQYKQFFSERGLILTRN